MHLKCLKTQLKLRMYLETHGNQFPAHELLSPYLNLDQHVANASTLALRTEDTVAPGFAC